MSDIYHVPTLAPARREALPRPLDLKLQQQVEAAADRIIAEENRQARAQRDDDALQANREAMRTFAETQRQDRLAAERGRGEDRKEALRMRQDDLGWRRTQADENQAIRTDQYKTSREDRLAQAQKDAEYKDEVLKWRQEAEKNKTVPTTTRLVEAVKTLSPLLKHYDFGPRLDEEKEPIANTGLSDEGKIALYELLRDGMPVRQAMETMNIQARETPDITAAKKEVEGRWLESSKKESQAKLDRMQRERDAQLDQLAVPSQRTAALQPPQARPSVVGAVRQGVQRVADAKEATREPTLAEEYDTLYGVMRKGINPKTGAPLTAEEKRAYTAALKNMDSLLNPKQKQSR